jgi:hypothetical protein
VALYVREGGVYWHERTVEPAGQPPVTKTAVLDADPKPMSTPEGLKPWSEWKLRAT